MSRLARAIAVLAFAAAYVTQPLALDACSVSCEAARAARSAAIAAPCHHTTSCASQITQPPSSGSTVSSPVQAAPLLAIAAAVPTARIAASPYYLHRTTRPPDLPVVSRSPVPLRV